MNKHIWIVAITATTLNGSALAAAQRPGFELMGLPITAHQIAVVGSPHVEERSPIPTLTLGGMPASPHQVAVLRPRPPASDEALATTLTTPGRSAH